VQGKHVLQAAVRSALQAAYAVAYGHFGSRDQHCTGLLTGGSFQQLRQAVLQRRVAATAAAMQAAALGRRGRCKKATLPRTLTQCHIGLHCTCRRKQQLCKSGIAEAVFLGCVCRGQWSSRQLGTLQCMHVLYQVCFITAVLLLPTRQGRASCVLWLQQELRQHKSTAFLL
jgi:hypothetical protein